MSLQSVIKPSHNKAHISALSPQEENEEGKIWRQRKLNDFFFSDAEAVAYRNASLAL